MLAFNRASIPSMANTMGSFTSGFTTIVDILSDSSGIGSQTDVSFNFEKLVGRLLPLPTNQFQREFLCGIVYIVNI